MRDIGVLRPKIFYTDDLSAEWQQVRGSSSREDADSRRAALTTSRRGRRAPVMRAVRLASSSRAHDGGASWELNKAFWEQPTRPDWSPGAGGLCMHSIATWPGNRRASALAISAGRRLAHRRRRQDVASREQELYPRYMPRRSRADTIDPASTTCTARRSSPERAVHAVPRRRLPLGRRRRELDLDRGRLPSDSSSRW